MSLSARDTMQLADRMIGSLQADHRRLCVISAEVERLIAIDGDWSSDQHGRYLQLEAEVREVAARYQLREPERPTAQELERQKRAIRKATGSMSAILFVDRNGDALEVGDRVEFVDSYYYINLHQGTGRIRAFTQHGGIEITTDQPMKHCDRNGATVRMGTDWYFPCSYDADQRLRVAARRIGDPHEHGEYPCWVEKRPAATGKG